MSIINDALKKARKEFEVKRKPQPGVNDSCLPDKKLTEPVFNKARASNKRFVFTLMAALALAGSTFGSVLIYRNMIEAIEYNTTANDGSPDVKIAPETKTPFVQEAQVTPKEEIKAADTIELSGIVFGPEGKWAIINNKIFREGDRILDNEVLEITRETVRIRRNDSTEVVLNLK